MLPASSSRMEAPRVARTQAAVAPPAPEPTGKFLLYFRVGPEDISVLPVTSGASAKPFPWLPEPFHGRLPKFSPDGRWVAYESWDSGRSEVYVAPFPGPGGKRQISTG